MAENEADDDRPPPEPIFPRMRKKRQGGPFEPTNQQRQLVQVLRANGISERMIAINLHIDRMMLRRHFKKELDDGKEQIIAALGASVIRAGLGGDWRAALQWLARHAGPEWRLPANTTWRADIGLPPPGGAQPMTIVIRGGLPEVPYGDDDELDDNGAYANGNGEGMGLPN